MSWVKASRWEPDERDSHPLLIVSDRDHWELVHTEIEAEAPLYPVVLITPGSPVYGMRVRNWEARHVRDPLPSDYKALLDCRVMP